MHADQDLADFLARNVPDVSLDEVVAGVVSKNVRAIPAGPAIQAPVGSANTG